MSKKVLHCPVAVSTVLKSKIKKGNVMIVITMKGESDRQYMFAEDLQRGTKPSDEIVSSMLRYIRSRTIIFDVGKMRDEGFFMHRKTAYDNVTLALFVTEHAELNDSTQAEMRSSEWLRRLVDTVLQVIAAIDIEHRC